MTTNHPAHGPVSLDRLHQIREILSKAAAQSDGGNLGYAMADAVKVIDEVLNVPEKLPCPVHLEPGLKFGKGVPTSLVLGALRRRANYYAEMEAMTPEQRSEHDAGISEFKAMLGTPAPDERVAFNAWNNDSDCPLAGLTLKQAAWLAWLKRSGIIKSFEPVTDEFEVWAKSEGLIHDSYGLRTVNNSTDVARKAWNACRAAMLQAGNSPVTPDGWIPVSERMPDKLIPVMVMYEDGEMWSAMWSGQFWDGGCTIPDPHAITHWREMPAAPQQEVKSAFGHGMQRYAGAMQKLSEGDK